MIYSVIAVFLAALAPPALPEPPPSPVSPAQALGRYGAALPGAAWSFSLLTGGVYLGDWEGHVWEGDWEVWAGVLTVREWPRNTPLANRPVFAWRVLLSRDRHGRVVRLGLTPSSVVDRPVVRVPRP